MSVHTFGAVGNRHAYAFDGGDLLAEFIVQFTGNLSAHFFNAGLNHLRQFSVLRQRQGGFAGFFARRHTVLQRLRHGIESGSHQLRLLTAHAGQAGVVVAFTDLIQTLNNLLNRLQGASHQPTDQQHTDDHAKQNRHQQRHEIVPAVKHRPRGVGAHQ